MDAKSRYQIISELEEKKRKIIQDKENFELKGNEFERNLKNMRRQIEDYQDAYAEYKKDKDKRVKTFDVMINSIDESLQKINSNS